MHQHLIFFLICGNKTCQVLECFRIYEKNNLSCKTMGNMEEIHKFWGRVRKWKQKSWTAARENGWNDCSRVEKKKQFDWIKFNLIKSTCLCLNWKLSGIEIIMYVHISTEGKETKVCTFSCWKLFVIKIWFSLNSSNPCIRMNLLLHHKVTKVLEVHILCEKLTLTLFHGKFS